MREAIARKNRSILEEARINADSTWKVVYRAGGVCLLLSELIWLAVAVLSIVIGPAPSGGEAYLTSVAQHAAASQVDFGIFALSDLLLLPAALALYLALKHVGKNAMLIATGLLILFAVVDLAVTELNSLALVTLTRQYAAAASDVQRAAYVAAADYALATLPIGTFFSYLVSSIGLLIASVVMLRGVFSRPTAFLGITAGILGTVGGFYFAIPALAGLLVPSLIAFGSWGVFAGLRLCELGKRSSRA